MLLVNVPDLVAIERRNAPGIVFRTIVDKNDFIAIKVLRYDGVDGALQVAAVIVGGDNHRAENGLGFHI